MAEFPWRSLVSGVDLCNRSHLFLAQYTGTLRLSWWNNLDKNVQSNSHIKVSSVCKSFFSCTSTTSDLEIDVIVLRSDKSGTVISSDSAVVTYYPVGCSWIDNLSGSEAMTSRQNIVQVIGEA